MAGYKVPQDVEADDKLIGPFSLRQFLYLIVVAMAGAIAWALAQLFIPLAIIPIPVILLFGTLALPLRKDQPMETYMSAMVSFYLKPHRRRWDPDGLDSLIEITAPKMTDVQRTKDISGGEAEKKLSYLAEIVDTQGWAIRGSGAQAPNSSMVSDAYFEAQQIEDVMDGNNSMAQFFSQRLDQSDTKRHQDAINMMRASVNDSPTIESVVVAPEMVFNGYFNSPTPAEPVTAPEPTVATDFDFDPYPEEMHQTVIQPISLPPAPQIGPVIPTAKPAPSTSEKPLAAGIINLANNAGLSIETIAREANRIQGKQDLAEEVIISLR